MKEQAFETLKSLYSGSTEPCVILDENWETLWSWNMKPLDGLYEKLGVREDSWENVNRVIGMEDGRYLCRLMCCAEEKLRAAQFMPMGASGFEPAVINDIVQGMESLCNTLYEDLDRQNLNDERDLLNVVEGNILRIHRMNYIQQELERMRAGAWTPTVVNLQNFLLSSVQKMESLLRSAVEMELECCPDYLFVTGDADALRTMLFAAVVLTVKKPQYKGRVGFELSCEEQTAVLTITAEHTDELRSDLNVQTIHFGSLAPEQELVDRCCKQFDIRVLTAEQGNTSMMRFEMPRRKESSGPIVFNSPIMDGAPGFFEPVSAMMARIRYRNRF